MDKQTQFDHMFLATANLFAKKSYAIRAKVGAVIVKDGNIMSFGYNGMPSGFNNCCEYTVTDENGNECTHTNREVLHAESNAIAKLAKCGGIGAQGATLYCTYSPCFDCAKMIVQAGIVRVVYNLDYRDQSSIEFLRSAGVEVVKIEQCIYQITEL